MDLRHVFKDAEVFVLDFSSKAISHVSFLNWKLYIHTCTAATSRMVIWLYALLLHNIKTQSLGT